MIYFIDTHSGLMSFISTLLLVCITFWYATHTRRQADASFKMFEQNQAESRRLFQERESAKLNYIFLINAEMLIHLNFFVNAVFYGSKGKQSFFNFLIGSQEQNIITLKRLTDKSLKDDSWRMIRGETATLFKNDLMQDLVGYYAGISNSHLLTDPRVQDNVFLNYIKGQLQAYFKVQALLEKEAGRELRKQNSFILEGKRYSVDPQTGELIDR